MMWYYADLHPDLHRRLFSSNSWMGVMFRFRLRFQQQQTTWTMAGLLRSRLQAARLVGIPLTAGPSRLRAPFVARYASTSTASSDDWELIVGLEIHAQIRTGRKLFSREIVHGCHHLTLRRANELR